MTPKKPDPRLAAIAEGIFTRHAEAFRKLADDGYAALTPEERAEDAAELALWDSTLLDGLEDD